MTRLTRLLGLTARTTRCHRVTKPAKIKELVWVVRPGTHSWKAWERSKIPAIHWDRHTPAFQNLIEQWEKEGRSRGVKFFNQPVPNWCDAIIIYEGRLLKFFTHGNPTDAEREAFVADCLESYSGKDAYLNYQRVADLVIPEWVRSIDMENHRIIMDTGPLFRSDEEINALNKLLREHYVDFSYRRPVGFPANPPTWIKTLTITNGVVSSITKFDLPIDIEEGSIFKKRVEFWIKNYNVKDYHYQAIPNWINQITIDGMIITKLSTTVMSDVTPEERFAVLNHLILHYPNLHYVHSTVSPVSTTNA
jgi:hypothetical protein